MTNLTTEARRHGEASGDRGIARDQVIGEAIDICHPERLGVEESETSCSRRIRAMPVPERAASGSSHEILKNVLAAGLYHGTGFSRAALYKNIWASAPAVFKGILHIIRAALREIFDESAYDRFLVRTHTSRSVASYRDFTRERDATILKRPRCC